MTYKQIVYMILDELKLFVDDASYTEDHVIFLADKYRAFLLKQEAERKKKAGETLDETNFQTVCMDLEEVDVLDGHPCEYGKYLRTTEEVPTPSSIASARVYSAGNYYIGEITLITRDRMRYIGHNKWLRNVIYASQNPDGRLYMWSQNPQFLYLNNITMTAIFDDAEAAAALTCDEDGTPCDVLDSEFPIEPALVPPLIELCVKELGGAIYRPADYRNNATDDLQTGTTTESKQ